MIHIGWFDVHLGSLILGIVLGVAVDMYVLRPLAKLLERVERRWNGRLRAR